MRLDFFVHCVLKRIKVVHNVIIAVGRRDSDQGYAKMITACDRLVNSESQCALLTYPWAKYGHIIHDAVEMFKTFSDVHRVLRDLSALAEVASFRPGFADCNFSRNFCHVFAWQ